jgi:quercetin dioxygenase-like cupin family protein
MTRFEILTDRVVESLSDISSSRNGHVVYDLDQGTAISFTLKDTDDVHVIDSFLSAGTIFPLHHHEASSETLTLYSGNITVLCDEPGTDCIRHELQIGVPFFIPDGMNHLLHAKEDSWVLASLIPPDQDILK